ncbi:unnamed protein product [Leptosia nina]|uniref:Pacifastin domain-containing protein n=1 Tax=Leptosia nina TaxID=320188 RepID=A0AAV1J6A4_9NEOP
MKWFIVISLFVYYSSLSEGSAIGVTPNEAIEKLPEVIDGTEQAYIKTTESSTFEDVRIEEECLPRSEWQSNCHSCRCSDAGRAICTKLDVCDKGIFGEPLKCKPQTSFKRDCNTCRCLDNGLVLCTLKGCSKLTIPDESKILPGKECSPGTRWKSRCNECVCSPEGLTNCSKNDCPGQENEPEMHCAPDSIWKDDCNSCWCTTSGYAMCTRIGCSLNVVTNWNPKPNKKVENTTPQAIHMQLLTNNRPYTTHKIEKRDVCTSGAILQVDCNICICSEDGVQITCTARPCFGSNDDLNEQKNQLTKLIETNSFDNQLSNRKRTICKPNSLFKLSCNECECAVDGLSYSCTADDCDERSITDDVEVFKEEDGPDHIERHSVCKPRGTFHMGCNTCQCNVDGTNYSCTNKPCPLPDDVEIFKELEAPKSVFNATKAIVCSANRMFIKDCNTCWCNKDGTGFSCTRKVCIVEPDENIEESTEKLSTLKQKCRPDEVFEIDCNTCRCSTDGQSYSCTRRICFPDTDDKDKNPAKSLPASVIENVFRKKRATSQGTPKNCQPNQEFRLDCNKCLCDNEGQNFSCTRIDCTALNNNNNGGDRAKREVASQEQKDCPPGSVFDQGCNVCQCTKDGNHAVCTMKRCHEETTDNDINAPESDPNFRCNPGEQFKRGCKDCTCSADGKSVFCTLRLCDQDINPAL